MSRGRQLVLDLAFRPAFGADDFLISDSNRDAVGWLDRWPDWPARGLAVYGPPGSGKSHLAAVWRARSHAEAVAAADLDAARVRRLMDRTDRIVVEDADRGVDERALLQLYNELNHERGWLLLTAIAAPVRWRIELPDLASRIGALPASGLSAPDDALLAGVIAKQFADQQLTASEEVVRYLIARMERSFTAARWLVTEIDRLSLANRQSVTVPLAREALARFAETHGLGKADAGV